MTAKLAAKTWRWTFLVLLAAVLLFVLVTEYAAPAIRSAGHSAPDTGHSVNAVQVQRGAYLARIGNCAQCHTRRGGPTYAGGDALQTPFGQVYAGNITPHASAGIGAWTAADFWRSLHHGIAPNGRVLNPAFPYTSYTRVSRVDSDALFAYLQTIPPIATPNKAHAVSWPLGSQTAITAWRLLHFSAMDPADASADNATPSARRGAYLVQGLGHCAECHTPRNALGGLRHSAAWAGAVMPDGQWYAPALNDSAQAGLASWEASDIATLLTQGQHGNAYVAGPMADIVRNSTQYLQPTDALSIGLYLQTLSGASAFTARSASQGIPREHPGGAKIYEDQCAECHGKQGKGVNDMYPALAANRSILMDNTNNLVLMVLHGAYGPSTAGKPHPFGMPPYQLVLNDADVAAVLSFIRNSWGNHAAPVTEFDVNKIRNAASH